MLISLSRLLLDQAPVNLVAKYSKHLYQITSNSRSRFIAPYTSSTMTKRISGDSSSSSTCGIVHVQHSTDKTILTISFEYKTADKSKRFNLRRDSSDSLASSLQRIGLNVSKVNKPLKKSKTSEVDQKEETISVNLSLDGSPLVPSEVTNYDAWVHGAILDINGQSFEVRTDEPQVEFLSLPAYIMQGYYTLPIVNLTNCEISDCLFTWYRQVQSKERDIMVEKLGISKEDFVVFQDFKIGYKVHEGLIYSPSKDDLAHLLRVVCQPCRGERKGLDQFVISNNPVELGPEDCPFEKRHTLTSSKLTSPSDFRFVTYNILANLYADSEYSRKELFAHCPAHALEIEYRRQLLLKEIHGYNADLICLQEVDKKEFARTYEPSFKFVAGYSGIYHAKGNVGEGLATFYNEEKFELKDTHRTSLRHLIDPKMNGKEAKSDVSANPVQDEPVADPLGLQTILEEHPLLNNLVSESAKECLSQFDDIRKVILSKEALAKRFLDRQTVLQTTLLKFRELQDRYILVANTHLYFAPDADHVRLLQGSVCSRYIEYIISYYRDKIRGDDKDSNPIINVIFCGDMNSVPECGLYKLLTEGYVPENLPDWSSNQEEQVTNLSLSSKIKYGSAYGNIPYTNYIPTFNGCLDHIYYEIDGLSCNSVVPLPDHEDVVATGGIPSAVFPSDHLALVANLSIKNL